MSATDEFDAASLPEKLRLCARYFDDYDALMPHVIPPMAAPDHLKDKVLEAAEGTQLQDFLRGLADKLDTDLFDEADTKHAPSWYDNDSASAWANGWNAAMRQVMST